MVIEILKTRPYAALRWEHRRGSRKRVPLEDNNKKKKKNKCRFGIAQSIHNLDGILLCLYLSHSPDTFTESDRLSSIRFTWAAKG